MPWYEALAIAAAGVAAGAINAIVGSGTLITFPTLLAFGFAPITANVSNNIGLVPGGVTGTWGYRRELEGQRRRIVLLAPMSLLGAVTGALLLLRLPAEAFRAIVPVLLAVSLLPMPFVSEPLILSLLLILSGMAIAPTLIASVAVTQASVDQSRLTEALAWISTGMAAGVAAGAAAAGQLIDHAGAQAGFFGVAIAGLLLTLSALFVRGRRTSVEPV